MNTDKKLGQDYLHIQIIFIIFAIKNVYGKNNK